MKGIVFAEFLEFVEQRFSPDMADDIIDTSELASGGAYTAVGTYDHREMLQLVTALSALTDTPAPELVRAFGRHLFARLAAAYPAFLEGVDTAFAFLEGIEDHIHVEVKKLYPDAELPRFDISHPAPGRMALVYHSQRPLADLAEGLIAGCCDHFGQAVAIEREPLSDGGGTSVRFLLSERE